VEDTHRMNQRRIPLPEGLHEIIRRIVAVARPEKIILFGSSAREDTSCDSDIDLLIVKSGDFHRGRLTEEIYMSLLDVGQPVDIVVATPEDVERYRDNFALVIAPALEESEVVYSA